MPQNRRPPKRRLTVPLNRALSKLGVLSRAQATVAIRGGRVRVGSAVVVDPAHAVDLDTVRLFLDDVPQTATPWRAILFHKPRGVVTTRRDPEGRTTIYDAIGPAARGLVAVGRLDLATSGLLLLTSDTRLADWIADPAHGVPRVYVVTVRGFVDAAAASQLTQGIGELRAHAVAVRKASRRESHLVVELREGKNREVRRLFAAIGREVTRLKRVRLGGLELGALEPGAWRDLTREEIRRAFLRAPLA